MEQGHLLDTNIVVYLLYGKLSPRATQKIKTATAIVNKLTLLSRNSSDFKKIKELDWINPFES